MAFPDPTINPPLLPRPGAHTPTNTSRAGSPARSASPSSDYSPTRFMQQTLARDPILRDLSPTKTLRALGSTSHTETEVDLMKSVEQVSEKDRAFGVRVAQTCKDLREWAVEVEAWEWPGTFEPPTAKDRTSRKRSMLAKQPLPQSFLAEDSDGDDDQIDGDNEKDDFWGSLPKDLVLQYEARIDAIQEAMREMDVEGLKSHVRNIHILPKAKSPKQDEFVSFRVRSVDDYTTLITATILQALPYLSWLTRLLNEWSVRLLILRKVPAFLAGLADTQRQLDAAWKDLSLENHQSKDSVKPVRERFESMQTVLGSKVSGLGQRLDSMLDELEGRSETIPEIWIDRFESLELAYSNWVVKAERTLTGLAWEFDLPSTAATTPGYDALGILKEPLNPHDSAVPQELDATPFNGVTPDAGKGERRVESPTLGERPWHRADSNTTIGEPPTKIRQDSEFNRLVDDVILESQDQATSPVVDDHAEFEAVDFAHMCSSGPPPEPRQEPQPPSPSKSPRMRARHVPIEVEAYRDAAVKAGIAPQEDKEEPFSLNREPPLPPPPAEGDPRPSLSSVAARRALFNGDLENKQILLKASSPVRPFEHASNAFTKLFKPASREPSRTRSNASKATLKKRPRAQSAKSRTSMDSKRASNLSLDTSSTRDRIKRALEASPREVQDSSWSPPRRQNNETTGSNSPERLIQSAHQNMDWSDKEVVVAPRPLSEGSPAVNSGRFDSPLAQGRMSVNWPLPSGAKVVEDEISSPGGAIRSDAFEQMFVDTLPISPVFDEAYRSNLATFDDYIDQIRRGSCVTQTSLEDDMIDGVYNHTLRDLRGQTTRDSRRGRRQTKDEQVSTRGYESSSIVRSQNSTPEIRDASSAGFFRPLEVNTPRKSRGKKKSRRDKHAVKVARLDRQQPDNSKEKRVYIDGDNDADRSASDKEAIKSPKLVSKRASLAALEAGLHLHDELERPSTAHTATTDASSYNSSMVTALHSGRDRSDTTRSEPVFPMPPNVRPGHLRTRSAKDGQSLLQALRSDSERSIVGLRLGATKPQPLSLSQLQHPPEVSNGPKLDTHVEELRPSTPQRSERRRDSIASSNGDYMDRHVSKVLRKMTSNIHFSTRPGKRASHNATPAQERSQNSAKNRPQIGYTLAPATPPSQGPLRNHVKDGETKLYHLSQPGREQPIKLFVRLVGNDERVMVRVGGGWMDLEDYLRQYAEHHTHRTISNGAIEITEAARVGSEKKKNAEGRYTRPESALGFRKDMLQSPDVSSSPPQHGAMNATPDAYNLDHPTRSQGGTPYSESVQSPGSQPSTYFDTKTTPSALNETPSKGESPPKHNPLFPKIVDPPVLSRPNSIGAPPSAKAGLDAQKAKWVEDMITRTKQSAAEKGKDGKKKELQELGKVGSTRRLGVGGGNWRDQGRLANKW
ncbi:GAS2-like protein 1 [Sphaceloma murrayae]|uniref:GAS2-like protein 1 n=1 Tax=Sphaceloma murrayae TaxID=2082308 RepID=A0A2K1QPG6_9PEZI|nr:GAS2-like protein 1 [Sphaceloma murrayae]